MNTGDELDCQDLVEIVTEYLEGTLPEREHLRLEAHLNECDGCDEYVAQMRTTRRLIGQFDAAGLTAEARARLINVFDRWKKSA